MNDLRSENPRAVVEMDFDVATIYKFMKIHENSTAKWHSPPENRIDSTRKWIVTTASVSWSLERPGLLGTGM